jgi:hypothetical protein
MKIRKPNIMFHDKMLERDITFFKRGPADPSQQCKRASNSIQDPQPRWILTIFKLKFGGGNLFSPAMSSTIEGNNSVGSLLKPLLKKVTPVVGSRMLWRKDTFKDIKESCLINIFRPELVTPCPLVGQSEKDTFAL